MSKLGLSSFPYRFLSLGSAALLAQAAGDPKTDARRCQFCSDI